MTSERAALVAFENRLAAAERQMAALEQQAENLIARFLSPPAAK